MIMVNEVENWLILNIFTITATNVIKIEQVVVVWSWVYVVSGIYGNITSIVGDHTVPALVAMEM